RAHGGDGRDAEPCCELPLERLDLGSLGQAARAYDPRHALGILRAHGRPGMRNHWIGTREAGTIRGWPETRRGPAAYGRPRFIPDAPKSKIQEQPDRLECLGVLDPRLDAAEVGARPRELENRQVLDVGLRYLGPVCLEAGELHVEHVG